MPPKNNTERRAGRRRQLTADSVPHQPKRARKLLVIEPEPPAAEPTPPTPKRGKSKVTKTPEPPTVQGRKTEKGVILTVGQGDVGQLGLGPDILSKGRFGVVPDLKDIVDICAGGMHTVCLNSDGEVFTFGCDDEGALGRLATEEDSFSPGKVELEGPVVQIAAGDSHTAALLEDGRVFAWGSFRDSHGSMGFLSNGVSKTPKLVKLDENVIRLSSGADHLMLLTDKGQLFSCGCPEQGQLGRVTARSARRDSRLGLPAFLAPKLIKFRINNFFVNVWSTTYGTFAVENSGRVYVFGLNNYHQLGLETPEPVYQPVESTELSASNVKWTKVEGGEHHTLLLDQEGKVYTLGRKDYGRLGLGKDADEAPVPTEVPALKNKKCVDIASGSAVSFAVTEDGQCYGWGFGSNGQLGAGDDESDVYEPQLLVGKQLEGKRVMLVAAGGQHTALLVRSS